MLSVENYERKFITNLIDREVSEAISDNESDDESSDVSDDESDDEYDDKSDDVMMKLMTRLITLMVICVVHLRFLFELNLHTDRHGIDISWRLEKTLDVLSGIFLPEMVWCIVVIQ